MAFFYALMFGAGASALAYSTLARRLGYGNSSSVFTFLGAIFVLTTIIFYTLLAFIFKV